MGQPKKSKYRGIYYSSPANRWVVELERLNSYPRFLSERDAAIFAEYHYRSLYSERINFPDLSDTDLLCEYDEVLKQRDIEQARSRSYSKQGVKKIKTSVSRYVGVVRKDDSRWAAIIQYRGKSTYIASFSISKYDDAEIRAARAYDQKALELYGENARLNFPNTAPEKK